MSNLITPTTITRAFKMHPSRIQSWFKRGLTYTQKSKSTRQIDLEVFRQWVKENPQNLAGIPADRLALLIDDAEVIKAIAVLPLRRHCRKISQVSPVICDYESLKDAAAANFIGYMSLCNALRKAKKSGRDRVVVCGSEFLVEAAQ